MRLCLLIHELGTISMRVNRDDDNKLKNPTCHKASFDARKVILRVSGPSRNNAAPSIALHHSLPFTHPFFSRLLSRRIIFLTQVNGGSDAPPPLLLCPLSQASATNIDLQQLSLLLRCNARHRGHWCYSCHTSSGNTVCKGINKTC